MPQLWHSGLLAKSKVEGVYDEDGTFTDAHVGPSGMAGGIGKMPYPYGREMTQADIDAVIEAFATAAQTAHRLGFDGVAFHGAHGYLFDQFFWDKTNRRTDRYGGGIAERTRFACEVVRECRRRTDPRFPLMFRMSQWKLHDYRARMFKAPQELEQFLVPLIDAGIDIFDCSQRRFWEAEFEGSSLNLAGWVKKISGKVTMTVGSVGLDGDLSQTLLGESSKPASLDRLMTMLDRGDFDLVGVGRALLADPAWLQKVKAGDHNRILPFNPGALATLA